MASRDKLALRSREGCTGRGGHPRFCLLCLSQPHSPIYTLPGGAKVLDSAKKQIILPAMPVFTQKPLVYEEQLSQSTQRNTLQYFLKRVVLWGFFIALRSKRLVTEIERTKQLNKQLLLVFPILQGLSQTLLSPSFSPHPVHSKEHPEPPNTFSWEGAKPPRGLITARAAQFGFVSPHQREGNERSERSRDPPSCSASPAFSS